MRSNSLEYLLVQTFEPDENYQYPVDYKYGNGPQLYKKKYLKRAHGIWSMCNYESRSDANMRTPSLSKISDNCNVFFSFSFCVLRLQLFCKRFLNTEGCCECRNCMMLFASLMPEHMQRQSLRARARVGNTVVEWIIAAVHYTWYARVPRSVTLCRVLCRVRKKLNE